MYHVRCLTLPPPPSPRPQPASQSGPKRPPARRRKAVLFLLCAGLVFAGLHTGWQLLGRRVLPAPRPTAQATAPPAAESPALRPPPRPFSKVELQTLTAGTGFLNLAEEELEIRQGNRCFTLRTTLDPHLQQVLAGHLDRRHARSIAVVAIDPADGRVLAMAGHDRQRPDVNPCLESRFPAASVFKIVTAAAAVETARLQPGTLIPYSGGKYTLYKSQIAPNASRRDQQITLRDSFAQSVNPVFGKLGANLLGRERIEGYAEAFGFNRDIEFELPLRPSIVELNRADRYELAEVASGFNRTTRISALHGALIAAAIVNRGRWVEPTIVDWVIGPEGRVLYQGRAVTRERIVDPSTARTLRELMRETVQSGTAHREFQKHSGDRVLAGLEIGGKTGSIGDGAGEARYDWFVGYAVDPRSGEKLAVAAVVAHGELIGTRAATYAAIAFREHFRGAAERTAARGTTQRS